MIQQSHSWKSYLMEIEAPVHKNLSMFTVAFFKGKNTKNKVNSLFNIPQEKVG